MYNLCYIKLSTTNKISQLNTNDSYNSTYNTFLAITINRLTVKKKSPALSLGLYAACKHRNSLIAAIYSAFF